MPSYSSPNQPFEQTISDDYLKAINAFRGKIIPDAVTGRVEMSDIIQYIDTHTDDPDVITFLSHWQDRNKDQKEQRRQALETFDIKKLHVQPGSIWLITLSFVGMSNEARGDSTWPGVPMDRWVDSLPENGVPAQIFHLSCLIKDSELEDESGDYRYVEDFVGLPTTQQVENFIKISMAMPIQVYEPCIPATLAFSYDLNVHKQALQPFLRTFPRSCYIIFETAAIRERIAEKDFIKIKARFREYIEAATEAKEAGNKAYAAKDRSKAVEHYEDAIEQLNKLLQRKISEEEERDKETRTLLAVCLSNCSAARMLDGPDGKPDAEGAKSDAENAIEIAPTYAKGYARLARAHEILGDLPGAQDALIRGLRHKDLQNHFGLADGLISLQTDGKGFPDDQDEFQKLLHNILEDDDESATRMKGVSGAYKKRIDEHIKKLGIV